MPSWERLTALDASFLGLEDGDLHMHVGATLSFEPGSLVGPHGEVDITRIRKVVASKLHLVPRYRQRLAAIPYEGHPIWIDDDRFNIEYHVRLTALPKPGDGDELMRLAGRIMSQQLDRGKPLWEMWVVEGVQGGGFAIICKNHHCMIDGIAGTDILTALLDMNPDLRAGRPKPWRPRRAPHAISLVSSALLRRIEAPAEFLRSTRRALRSPRKLLRDAGDYIESIGEILAPGLNGGSQTPLNAQIGTHRRFRWLTMDLGEVKAVKNALGGTLNDVVLATVTGMLRRFFRHRGIAVAGLDIKALVPVSVRPDAARGQMGNQIATMVAPLPLKLKTARARLAAVHKTTQGLKESKQAIGAERLAAVADWTVPNILVQAVRIQTRARAYNLVVTNVPGPQIPLYMDGARMTTTYPLVPLLGRNQCLGIALMSYNGKLFWGLNGDFEGMSDLDMVAKFLQAAFEELQEAAGIQPAKAPRKAQGKRAAAKQAAAGHARPAAAGKPGAAATNKPSAAASG